MNSTGIDMHLNAKPPVFVPQKYRAEIEKLSKAALMDIAWDYAAQLADDSTSVASTMDEFRKRRALILQYRK